ncbi:MAG TPA: hypothetical protein PJ982_02195 [Lacipirellulaceae bacterium]|nr:hypothetical protein [Lacipirellulaceae bacterium]
MSTRVQADVAGALFDLKFEDRGVEMPGAPHPFAATAETVAFVQALAEEGKLVTVDGDGNLSFG